MNKKDKRGIPEIDPNVELKDYSGPFKPDLRYSDFSRERLVRMYLMAGEYFTETLDTFVKFLTEKYGAEELTEIFEGTLANRTYFTSVRQILLKGLGITEGNDIESLMKVLQVGHLDWCPFKFDITYEVPSKDRYVLTCHKCPEVDILEDLGQQDKIREFCERIDLYTLVEYAKIFNPDIEVTAPVLPPRKSKDDICCKFEFTYKSK